MNNQIIVTTSWDDGHKLDLKLAGLLNKYSIKGTFYISKNYFEENRLTEADILAISKNHEIGAHTINHPDLAKISANESKKEIIESKLWIESVIGGPVKMFCYPFGNYNGEIAVMVKEVGFKGARTVEQFIIDFPSDLFAFGTTIQTYPRPFRKKDRDHYFWGYLFQSFLQTYSGARKMGIPAYKMISWKSMATSAFDIALNKGQVFHLWGH